ncbi:MAG: phosphoribosyl-AMP cyclohydrolase [Pseudomonadales bacterium]|nr:phosphoribosyl-AMP cyclohydrolase [Pseudomonadales bacterium]
MTDLKALEVAAAGTSVDLAEFLDAVEFNDQGLVPAIAQDGAAGTVLMLAWMNRASIEQTLATGLVTYFSRSRQSLWQKGETSGNTQRLLSMQFDCDGDAILMQVDQTGPACHTDRPNCFYLNVQGGQVVVSS